jgi:ribosomal protein S18 acetylase RimI-like enzyme
MISDCQIRLGLPADVRQIAAMSRDYIEHGLGWRWTPPRILAAMRAPDSNLAVASRGDRLVGFGLMQYKDDEAHLILLAVDAGSRRTGIASALVAWLERCALTAGIGTVYLEARTANAAARAFYRRLGYREIALVPGYYQGIEDGVRIARDLWLQTGDPPPAAQAPGR